MNNEFYVGYAAKAPAALGRWLRAIAISLTLGLAAVAVLLVYGQTPFAPSKFEFQQYCTYQGAIASNPYPVLLSTNGPYLLVAPGKHGADEFVRGKTSASLEGALIERDGMRMLEVLPGSVQVAATPSFKQETEPLGPATLTGVIVDTKCYLGVMNPGDGKVHRDCAARCISGGIPPGFLVKDAAGKSRVLLLAAPRVVAVKFAGDTIRLSGRLVRAAGLLQFDVAPDSFPQE